jgi:hypothetical protein
MDIFLSFWPSHWVDMPCVIVLISYMRTCLYNLYANNTFCLVREMVLMKSVTCFFKMKDIVSIYFVFCALHYKSGCVKSGDLGGLSSLEIIFTEFFVQ